MKLYRVIKSNIDKKGLVASKNIKSGKKIIQYRGKKVTNKEVEANPKFDNSKDIYLFVINKKFSLDGDFSWNTARLINHSCNPNCEVEFNRDKIWVTAIRDIKKNEELTYDYGFSFDSDYKQFPCKCGSINCVGFIVREGSRWRINKKFKKILRVNR